MKALTLLGPEIEMDLTDIGLSARYSYVSPPPSTHRKVGNTNDIRTRKSKE